ncbi:hypothetical protein Tco_1317246 [Tanacetum coccineum]
MESNDGKYGDSDGGTLDDSILILEIMSRRFFLRGIYLITGSRKDGDGDTSFQQNYYSDYQYAVSIKDDTVYPCMLSLKTTKKGRSIRRIQKMSIRHIEDIVCEYSGDIKRGPYSKKLQYADEVPPKSRIDIPLREKRHFKTLSLDELRSPDFNLLSDQEYSEEEVAETMAKTIEQYMSKTRADYGSGVARPKIEDKDKFELKGQFLKELRTNTFSGSDHEDANEHIEKVLEIVDLSHILNITIDQVMLRDSFMSLITGAQEPDENLYQAWEQFKELLMKCPQTLLSLDPFFEDYIELNDLNKPFELRRNQGDDLTIEEGTFFVVMDFAVIENIDAYRDEGMGDVILGAIVIKWKISPLVWDVWKIETLLVITEYLEFKQRRILELKQRYFEDYYSEDQYAISIKEDTAYPCLHSPKTTKETSSIRRI